jgi:serine/threonine protein kinase
MADSDIDANRTPTRPERGGSTSPGSSPNIEDTPTIAHGSSPPSEQPPVVGMVGRYELLQELPTGGMGVVYKARDTSLRRIVALKMIRGGILARAEEIKRFEQEAQAIARLKHGHIIEIHEIGRQDGRHFFTMDFAEGGSLAQHLERFTGDLRAAVTLVEKVARAVHHAHERGVLHRDLKPANVLLDEHGEPKVCDFGLAKVLDSDMELTHTGQTIGTPAYMAPEQVAGPPDALSPAVDVWALGVLLYQLLTGKRPFGGTTRDEVLYQVRTTEPKSPRTLRPDLDRALAWIVLKCLAKEPGLRYGSAAALADDLGRWQCGEPVTPPTQLPWPSRAAQWVRRHPGRCAAAVAMLILLALAGLKAAPKPEPTPTEPPIVLLGKSGPPDHTNWFLGADAIDRSTPAADGAYSFATTNRSMVELLAECPWDHYWLEAEVRNDAAVEVGEVGILFAHRFYPDAAVPHHTLLTFGFSDHGRITIKPQIQVMRRAAEIFNSSGQETFPTDMKFTPAKFIAKDFLPYRKLALEVSPEGLRVLFEGQHIRTISCDEIETSGERIYRGARDTGYRFDPRGGIGLFVDGDGTAASFRNIVIRKVERP